MIHSLYGNKEIFLRELVSNASDACDRLRFDAIANAALLEDDTALRIRVSYDKSARTITVSDNGIGMSRDEVIAHIGTIAKSGTREFFQRLNADAAKEAQLIGQFGVGFYSSFIVADKVTLVTRRAGLTADEGVRWESSGEGEYSIEAAHKDGRGTDVILHLRPAEDELLSGSTLRAILREVLRSHHCAHSHEEGAVGSDGARAGADRGGRTDQPGLGTLGAAQVGDHRSPSTTSSTSMSRTTSSRRWRTATPRWRAARNTRSSCSSRNGRPTISGTAIIVTASSCMSGASSSWTMPST